MNGRSFDPENDPGDESAQLELVEEQFQLLAAIHSFLWHQSSVEELYLTLDQSRVRP